VYLREIFKTGVYLQNVYPADVFHERGVGLKKIITEAILQWHANQTCFVVNMLLYARIQFFPAMRIYLLLLQIESRSFDV